MIPILITIKIEKSRPAIAAARGIACGWFGRAERTFMA
jgi:hypothetical protein